MLFSKNLTLLLEFWDGPLFRYGACLLCGCLPFVDDKGRDHDIMNEVRNDWSEIWSLLLLLLLLCFLSYCTKLRSYHMDGWEEWDERDCCRCNIENGVENHLGNLS